MDKNFPNRFSIQLNLDLASHRRVAEYLNSLGRKKAHFIVEGMSFYLDNKDKKMVEILPGPPKKRVAKPKAVAPHPQSMEVDDQPGILDSLKEMDLMLQPAELDADFKSRFQNRYSATRDDHD
ncbi:MAG: hypothetical protein GX776_00835 [Oxalobacter sp.]|nr:hypothetical protein [Oxalobacter sp.]